MKKLAAILLGLCVTSYAIPVHADKKIDNIGITVGTLGNPFFQSMIQSIEKTVKASAPDAKSTVLGADYELNKQASQIDTFIASGAQIIFINAGDSIAIKPFVDRATAAGIIVAAVDVTAEGATLTVMTNNVQAGEIACADLADRLKGKGDVVIISGAPTSAVTDRQQGCMNVFNKYPDIKILSDNQDSQGSREGGLKVMQGLLTKFPKIDAVFAINDPAAIGAELAARQLNRSEMIISAVDGSPDLIESMKKPGSLIVSSAAQDPYYMGELAAKLAIETLNGKAPENKISLIETKIVTKDNVNDYVGWDAVR